jgi:hypothetical protein
MKLKTTHLAALAAFTLAGPASAAVLLTDNFNTNNENATTFNTNLATDQGGSLATVSYTTVYSLGHEAQHSNSGTMLLVGNLPGFPRTNIYASLNHNFATDANTLDQALEIKFNLSVGDGFTPTSWASIALGASQNVTATSAGNQFSSTFMDDNTTEQYSDGTSVGSTITFADGDLITLLLSNTAGTGSAFNGNGSVAKLYVNGTLGGTWTGLNLGAGDGFLSFQANDVNARIDNLSISAIPEPSAALLGGLGMLALLRRRRA